MNAKKSSERVPESSQLSSSHGPLSFEFNIDKSIKQRTSGLRNAIAQSRSGHLDSPSKDPEASVLKKRNSQQVKSFNSYEIEKRFFRGPSGCLSPANPNPPVAIAVKECNSEIKLVD